MYLLIYGCLLLIRDGKLRVNRKLCREREASWRLLPVLLSVWSFLLGWTNSTEKVPPSSTLQL